MRSVEAQLTQLRMQRLITEKYRQQILDDIARKQMWLMDTDEEMDEIDTTILNLQNLLADSSTAA